ncbi:MAG: hypothetical protein JW870_10255 [Candidatus Delongbacteria bacterium]|nr:hypothetical protein [Candidatus Delongbacteria bacterium]
MINLIKKHLIKAIILGLPIMLLSCQKPKSDTYNNTMNLLLGEWLYSGTFIGDSMLTDTIEEIQEYDSHSNLISSSYLIQDYNGFWYVIKDSLSNDSVIQVDYPYKREYVLTNDTLDELYYSLNKSSLDFEENGSPSFGYFKLIPENDTVKLKFYIGDTSITKIIKSIDNEELIFNNTKFITKFKRL